LLAGGAASDPRVRPTGAVNPAPGVVNEVFSRKFLFRAQDFGFHRVSLLDQGRDDAAGGRHVLRAIRFNGLPVQWPGAVENLRASPWATTDRNRPWSVPDARC